MKLINGEMKELLNLALACLLLPSVAIGDSGWKYPRQVTEAERTVISGKLESVKPEMQGRFDVEYAKLDKSGMLKGIGLFRGDGEYRYQRQKREIAAENARTVVKSILEQDEGLRVRCEGIPVEWLSAAMKCPEPSLDEKELKAEFRFFGTGEPLVCGTDARALRTELEGDR